ncbi:Glycosyltransferase [Nitrospira japonica]|uniref:Glycosyltransferase n=1 Tax=Nitrospira japonica TaxID=1325564 RepID=A0A1W1I092_9BACT|nr:glycosyltransferase family 4 protein [Nitrospira japonica]SLM46418.1 Glycosyltransferase [Nitrospira japonica]
MPQAHIDANLVLYFTRGVSLQAWKDAGLLEREVSLYQSMRPHLQGVAFVTYGGESENSLGASVQGIRIVYNKWAVPKRWYGRLMSWVPPWRKKRNVIVKSNQIQGADVAQLAARRYGKPFIARCGYLPSNNAARIYGDHSSQARRARDLERTIFAGADRVVVTTPAIRETILKRYQISPDLVRVIPNYVDTTIFIPEANGGRVANRLMYVGRLDEEKNPLALIEAVRGLSVELLIIGNGSLGERLRREIERENLPVRLLGNIPNHRLPALLTTAAAFIMPSLIEGHPKALLEAMACGSPVIGTDVPGIREVIQHRSNGFLCGTSPVEIRSAIESVLGDRSLQCRMGNSAREYVVHSCSLDRIVEMELELLGELSAAA